MGQVLCNPEFPHPSTLFHPLYHSAGSSSTQGQRAGLWAGLRVFLCQAWGRRAAAVELWVLLWSRAALGQLPRAAQAGPSEEPREQ